LQHSNIVTLEYHNIIIS